LKKVIKELHAVGYDGYIGLEDFSGSKPTMQMLKHNKGFIDALLDVIT
jgi:sugar phosphate isomerase/epimerase